MLVELLWFDDCPNHLAAEVMLREVLAEEGVDASIVRVKVEDEDTGNRVCFPGSPTIRVEGRDVEPGWEPCAECAPRCRLYMTRDGLRGLPERGWIIEAIRRRSGSSGC